MTTTTCHTNQADHKYETLLRDFDEDLDLYIMIISDTFIVNAHHSMSVGAARHHHLPAISGDVASSINSVIGDFVKNAI